MPRTTRRQLLAATALFGLTAAAEATARTVSGAMPWGPNQVWPVPPIGAGLQYLRPDEAAVLEAIVARLIPTDDLGPGARDTGGVTFIDRQLAGPYGGHDWLYMQGPFPADPLPTQGLQSPLTPRQEYRRGLAALTEYCRATYSGKTFQQLDPSDQDKILTGLEKGETALPGANGRSFFNLVLTNTQEGFFADPIYGGNQDMAGWKLIGFPGVRYDFRDVIANPNQPYKLPPVGLQGRPEWGKRA